MQTEEVVGEWGEVIEGFEEVMWRGHLRLRGQLG